MISRIIKNIEKEIKIILTEEQFKEIKNKLKYECNKSEKINQINYYIDSSDFDLKRNKITVKLREYIGRKGLELTLKYNLKEFKEFKLKQKNEIKIWIELSINDIMNNSKIKSKLFKQIKIDLKKFSNYDLKKEIYIMGKLTTEREMFEILEFEKAVILDKSMYLDEIDYELELETENHELEFEKIKKLIKSCGEIPMDYNKSKSTRFFNRYKQIY